MRLPLNFQNLIVCEARRYFGDDCRVWLFGSRVDDRALGGDVDLYIETSLTETAAAKSGFKAALWMAMGEQKIDVVVRRRHESLTPIAEQALSTGIELLGIDTKVSVAGQKE